MGKPLFLENTYLCGDEYMVELIDENSKGGPRLASIWAFGVSPIYRDDINAEKIWSYNYENDMDKKNFHGNSHKSGFIE